MHPAARIAARIRARHIVTGRLVWEILEPTTADLVAHGFITLHGLGAAQVAMKEAQVEEEALFESFDTGMPVDAEARKREAFLARMEKQAREMAEVLADAGKTAVMETNIRAHVAAAVQRLGVLRDDLEVLEGVPDPDEVGGPWWTGAEHRELMPDGWDPGPFLEGPLFRTSVYVEAPEGVGDETRDEAVARRAQRNELWAGSMSADELATVYQAVRMLSGGRARRVAGFRWPDRHARHAAQDGEGLRGPAEHADSPSAG